MAEWDGEYIRALPDSAFACIDSSGRHYPHHNAAGNLDLPHLRNALSRVAQEDTTSCGVSHLRDHAEEEAVGETKSMTVGEDGPEVFRPERAMAVKFVAPDTIEGLAFPFDSYDTDQETFTKSTDYCEDWFPGGRPLLYEHGLDRSHEAVKVGRQVEYEDRDSGRWAQSQLDIHAKYRKRIDELIEQGVLGYSSGAYPHLAQKNARNEITRWPWVELSLTPIPAHPGTLGVHYVKSAAFLDLFEEVPPAVKAAIEALDGWASDQPESAHPDTDALEVKAGRVSAAVAELRDHARASNEMRAKAGRVLSFANRERIRTALSSREAVLAAYADLEALLSETDPDTKSTDDSAVWEAILALAKAAEVQ